MSEVLDTKYRLENELGRGATAIVYRAVDREDQHEVALKRMQLSPGVAPADAEHLVARFLQEGQTLRRLNHPHIPQVYEIGTWQQDPAIVMELIRGEKLYAYIQSQPPLAEVVQRLAEIADALQHAHSQGVVHRDIKPDNILVSPTQGAALTDFGVARQEESILQTSDGTMLGTIAYMAPEQLYNSAQADVRCDIYSLGVVMYELFTGQLPFDGASPAAVILKIFNSEAVHPLKVLPDLPPALAELIMQCLQKDAQQRIQTAKHVAYALNEIGASLSAAPAALPDISRTQVGIARLSQPMADTRQTLGELEGLRLSKEVIQPQCDADGRFNRFGLLMGLEQAMRDGFSGAIKVKAHNEQQALWFKGVIWLKDGVLQHAQLIRDLVSARADLKELIDTASGEIQRTPNTPSPQTILAGEDSRALLQAVALELGYDWTAPSAGSVSYLVDARPLPEAQRLRRPS